jgi:DNA-binding MarR family transcriptional regulator
LWYDQFEFEFCNTQLEGVVKRKLPLKEDTARVLEYLRLVINERNGAAPSMREIANGCYMAVSQVSTHLEILEAYGLIRRAPGRARAIWLVGSDKSED